MSGLREKILKALVAKFGEGKFEELPGEVGVVRISGLHPMIDEVLVSEDGDEATVEIRDLTHFHIYTYDEGLSREQKDDVIASELVDFFDDLFHDKIRMERERTGGRGGWERSFGERGFGPMKENFDYCYWSKVVDVKE